MLVGYARVSTADQDPALQLDALRAAGCERVFEERASGARADRPVLAEAFGHLRAGDVLVVWRLDRLGRSLKDLIARVAELEGRGVGFRSLAESIDTTTAGGRLVLHVFGALAEFERELIRERTLAGLAAARARGRKGGRPSKMTRAKVRQAAVLLADRETDVGAVCETLGVSKTTLYRHVSPTGDVRKMPDR
ncbi:recombinase family protein [Rubrivirga sp. S365]|uniref:recombinase family protein n=1 Tax=Rubrivirga sp. S365 TaxID=3076080 RepID=UPI0028C5A339|nr:recombinase family protein [Rubrivirga sp. S365]MDT7858188.1 recombinase family protein [Rubrivirga sp. S365]